MLWPWWYCLIVVRNMLKSVFGNYLQNHWLFDMTMYNWPPIMWSFRTLWVVRQPPRSNGSRDTGAADGRYFAEKGRGHFSHFAVSGKCVTNQILFQDLQLVDSWRVYLWTYNCIQNHHELLEFICKNCHEVWLRSITLILWNICICPCQPIKICQLRDASIIWRSI